jgi:nucleoside-diphosphate-sugar epimerase
MKILVTGNQGYIGSVLTPYFLAKGDQVVGLDTGFFADCFFGEPQDQLKNHTQIKKDIRDVELSDLAGIDAIIHLAGLSNDPAGDLRPDATERINYDGTVRLADLAQKTGVQRFVYASSQSMYGIAELDDELDEDLSKKNPLTEYARTKWLAECELNRRSSSTFQVVSLRPSTVFGASPRLRCDIVYNNLLGCALTQNAIEIKSDGSPWRPVVHIKDVCLAFDAALSAPANLVTGRSFNLGIPNGNFTVRQLAESAQAIVPGSTLRFTGEHGNDSRTYRVSFKRILSELSDYYAPKHDLISGGGELVRFLKKINFSAEDFHGQKVNRLMRLNALEVEGQIDGDLRWVK